MTGETYSVLGALGFVMLGSLFFLKHRKKR
ncbi:TPA: LPXTG cell wall anchor domain-containing protein [Streptococcus suis]